MKVFFAKRQNGAVMSYQKKVVVLKQTENGFSQPDKILGGIVRIEKENGISSLFLSLINFAPAASGEYCLFIADGNKTVFKFPLGKYPRSLIKTFNESPDLSHGFAAGVCLVAEDIPLLVAYQRSDDCNVSLSDFKKIVAEKCAETRKHRQKAEDSPVYNMKPPTTPATTDAPSPPKNGERELFVAEKENFVESETPPAYDDEAVATENFYDVDESIKMRTDLLKSYIDEQAEQNTTELQYENATNKTETIPRAPAAEQAREETNEEINKEVNKNLNEDTTENAEIGFIFSEKEKNYSIDNPYYETVKKELADLFDKFPAEEQLEKTLYGGKFVKINYSAEKYYVAGVLKEEAKEKYICYGIPAAYSKTPPKELDGYCSFIPLSVFDLKGDGYWMMFQDAITGECIKPK